MSKDQRRGRANPTSALPLVGESRPDDDAPVDERTGMSPEALETAVLRHLQFSRLKSARTASLADLFEAVALATRDRLAHRWTRTRKAYHQADVKRVYYLSAEFLLGRALASNLINLDIFSTAQKAMAAHGVDLSAVIEQERDPGLGNGGLGRLAACFLDSMTTLGLPGYGYGIRYDYGIFEQQIINGEQVERGDDWLRFGNPWEIPRFDHMVDVNFHGRLIEGQDQNGNYSVKWVDTQHVIGVPYDMLISGYETEHVNTLRLWSARAAREFNLEFFNSGDYRRAVETKALSESISKVLYPNDQSPEGRELRLKQQYFFVACSLHDIINRYLRRHETLDAFPDKVAIQLNDTHPAITVAELMRVFVDEHQIPWERAWALTEASVAYTNHTLLPEALERWPVEMFGRLLPRHLSIIHEVNRRFLRQVHVRFPGDLGRQRRMSIIEEGATQQIRMAHLAVVGSHSVNGVAALHSELVRTELLPDFAEMWPQKFNNKTNGVTPRRWLLQCNPRLAAAITRRIGDAWPKSLDELTRLAPLAKDADFVAELGAIKRANKVDLATWLAERLDVRVSPDALFDVQIKRIHEYKRQLLNCLHIVARYLAIRDEPERDVVPRVFLFGGKAAPGYVVAKQHIRLINDLAATINSDPIIAGRLRVVFVPNYSVSLAERIIPATDLSEQISTAGKEASGTGNMKFAMNGALTIGTLDGANVEIREAVGADNFFLFGLNADEVRGLRRDGYRPGDHIERSVTLSRVLDLIESGFFAPDDPGRHAHLTQSLRVDDPYLLCADFDAYVAAQAEVDALYLKREAWHRRVVANIAHNGRFSSDRTISQYAAEIWGVAPVAIPAEEA